MLQSLTYTNSTYLALEEIIHVVLGNIVPGSVEIRDGHRDVCMVCEVRLCVFCEPYPRRRLEEARNDGARFGSCEDLKVRSAHDRQSKEQV